MMTGRSPRITRQRARERASRLSSPAQEDPENLQLSPIVAPENEQNSLPQIRAVLQSSERENTTNPRVFQAAHDQSNQYQERGENREVERSLLFVELPPTIPLPRETQTRHSDEPVSGQ